jgi:nucleoid DNA-binding protein
MARLLQAITAYGPKLDLNQTAQLNQVVDWMSSRTGLNKSEVMMVMQELNEAISFFNGQGTPVKLPDIGTFSPGIKADGTFKINFRTDNALKNHINTPGAYTGRMSNKGNIGLTNEEYKALWDADNPSDPLEI